MRLRSPHLARMPREHTPVVERIGRVSRRLVIGGSILAAIVLLVVLTALELLPRNLGAPLYFLHDAVYLEIKGHFYTRQYPTSIIWWGILATVLLAVIGSQLSDRSFIKEPHLRLLQMAVYRPRFGAPLWRSSAVLQCMRLQPRFIQRVVRREWERTYLALSAAPNVRAARDLLVLAQLRDHLDALTEDRDEAAPLRRLEVWHDVMLSLSTLDRDARSAIREEIAAFLDHPPPLVASDPALHASRMPARDRFLPHVLGHEIALLVDFQRAQLGPKPNSSKLKEINQIIGAVEARRRDVIDQSIAGLERALLVGGGARPDVVAVNGTPAELPTAGRLALAIAVHTALMADNYAVGLAYAEAFELLDMLLDATTGADGGRGDSLRQLLDEPIDPAEQTVRYAGLNAAFRLLGRRATLLLSSQQPAWDALVQSSDLVTKDDIALLDAQAALLRHAGGAPNA